MGVRRIGKVQMPESQSPVEAVQNLASKQILHPKQKYSPPEVTIANANESRGYESPVTIREIPPGYFNTIAQELDNATNQFIEQHVLETVLEVGIDVDKERLLKALKDDRASYDKGYRDGLLDGYMDTWKTMLLDPPNDGEEVMIALIGEENEVFIARWSFNDRTFQVKASNRIIPESDVLEWSPLPKRVRLPF